MVNPTSTDPTSSASRGVETFSRLLGTRGCATAIELTSTSELGYPEVKSCIGRMAHLKPKCLVQEFPKTLRGHALFGTNGEGGEDRSILNALKFAERDLS
jgi:hypothetical protein